jgi:serine/threonine-protein kinase
MTWTDELVTGGALRGLLAAEALSDAGVWTRFEAGDRVGPFRLLRPIGEGGSSIVFLAERDNGTFTQTVALKLWREAGVAMQRALAEGSCLARLNHPGIARVIDAGALGERGAWLAMAHVDGISIDAWCQAHEADWRQRLDLLATVAEAVQHAHRQLLAHGDITPANVLVEADGKPCLLDFGIAQWLGRPQASRACTPAFASPEQLRGEPITAASDVFQLGGLALCLLPDSLPMPAVVRAELAGMLARARCADLERRYPSASEFAADLRRVRAGYRAHALPPTLWRQLRFLFLREGRKLLGLGALVVVLALLVADLRGERADALAQVAREQAAKDELARLNASLLTEAIRSVDGDPQAFRHFVRKRQAEVLAENRLDPVVRYGVLAGLATAHAEAGDFDEARFAIARAFADRARSGLPDDIGVAELHCLDARVAALSGDVAAARAPLAAAARYADAADPGDHPRLAKLLWCLGETHTQLGDVASARARFEAGLAMVAQSHGAGSREHLDLLAGMAEVARIWMDPGRAYQANAYVATHMRERYGDDARRVLDQHIRLQGARAAVGDGAAAEQELAAVIARLRREGRTDGYSFHAAHYFRAEALQWLGRYDEATAMYQAALAMLAVPAMEASSLHLVSDRAIAARMQVEVGRPEAAVAAQRAALAFATSVEGDSATRALLMLHLADALLAVGDDHTDEIGTLLDQAQPIVDAQFGPTSFHAGFARLLRLHWLLSRGDVGAAAAVHALGGGRGLDPTFPQHARLLVRWQLASARLAAAERRILPARRLAVTAVELAAAHFGPDHPLTAVTRVEAAGVGGVDRAFVEAQLAAARPVLRRAHPPESRYRRSSETWFASDKDASP